jgi:hypothetical protein
MLYLQRQSHSVDLLSCEERKYSNEELSARAKAMCIAEVFARLLLPEQILSTGKIE